jgi:hypothetical protein
MSFSGSLAGPFEDVPVSKILPEIDYEVMPPSSSYDLHICCVVFMYKNSNSPFSRVNSQSSSEKTARIWETMKIRRLIFSDTQLGTMFHQDTGNVHSDVVDSTAMRNLLTSSPPLGLF